MAKKKRHAKKRHVARAAPKSQSNNSVGWIIAIIVVIVIIFLLRGGEPEVMEEKETPDVFVEESGELSAAVAPEFGKKCTIAGGVKTGSTSQEGGVVTTTYLNNAREANEGTYFEFKDASGDAVYRKNSQAVGAKETVTYTVDLADVANELGAEVETFTIYPVQGGVACLNQPAKVILY